MKIYKIADIVEGEIKFNEKGRANSAHVCAILTKLEAVEEPDMGSAWKVEIKIGHGDAARVVQLELQPQISKSDLFDCPQFIGRFNFCFFKNRLFMPERWPTTAMEREEVILRVKKYVYDEDVELVGLRASVANLEAIIEFSKSGQRRVPIPEDVKLLVWARDGGACVQCGSKINLHFDHIIPVAKGGGNISANIQILCQICNLRKSDKIAI